MRIYKPGELPIRGLRTSLQGAQLADGYFQAIDGLRWDTGAFIVRNGVSTVSSTAPGTLCLGVWSGSLNGTYYVVSAWLVSNRTAIYSLNLTTGVFTEITDAGNATHPSSWGGDINGKTRIGVPVAITGASSASPISITASNHGYSTGDTVSISSVGGNTAANGNWIITKTGTNTFTLDGSTWTSGAYTSGGAVCRYSVITFCVHTIQRRVISTSVYPPIDVLSISSLHEYPLVWNPTVLSSAGPPIVEHRNISIPDGGTQFSYLHRHSAFLQVASAAAAKTFTNKAADNTTAQTRFKLIDSGVAPYASGSNVCIDLVVASPLAGDNCRVAFTTAVDFAGEQICIHVQGTAVAIADFIAYTQVQVSETDTGPTDYVTIYNPTSTDAAETIPPIQVPYDTLGNRVMMVFSMKGVSASLRTLKYIKFIRPAAASTSSTLTILAITGTAGNGGFFGDTEWSAAYSDHNSFAESGGISGSSRGSDLIKNMGGPTLVTSGASSVQGTKLPVETDVLYDFSFYVKNVESGTINGGAQGVPVNVDFYYRTAEESAIGAQYLYWNSGELYNLTVSGANDYQWKVPAIQTVSGSPGSTPKAIATFQTDGILWSRDLRDPGVPAPSAFNIAMPRALAVSTANQRTFAGAIKDDSGNYCFQDLYFSALGFPFRFASTQDSEEAASRLTFAGEKIRALVMTSAAANAASIIYVITDQTFNGLGTAGGFVGSGYDATSLSTRVRINAHGTNEPRSVQERAGVIFYIDQEGQIIRFENGVGRSISRNAVDNFPKNIPANRRGMVSAAFFHDRYYLAFTAGSGTKNTRILAWNEAMGEWEFCDTLPSTVIAQFLCRAFDSAQIGSGQRLLVFSDDNKVYGYEEGIVEPGSDIGPLIQVRTREYQSPEMLLFRFGANQIMFDHHAQVSLADITLNIDCYYKPRGTQFRGTVDITDSESKPQAIRLDSKIRTEQSATGKSEDGWAGCMDLNGHAASGKVFWRWEVEMEMLSKGAGER